MGRRVVQFVVEAGGKTLFPELKSVLPAAIVSYNRKPNIFWQHRKFRPAIRIVSFQIMKLGGMMVLRPQR